MNVSETVKTQTVIVFNSPVFSKIASHMHHAFLYISLPFNLWTTTTWNCLILRVMEDVNKPRRNNISLPELGYCPLWNSTSGRFAHIWQSKWVGIIAIKTVGNKIHFLSDVFADTLRAVVSPGRTLRSVRPGETTARRVPGMSSRPIASLNLKDWKVKTAKYKLLIRKLLTRKT